MKASSSDACRVTSSCSAMPFRAASFPDRRGAGAADGQHAGDPSVDRGALIAQRPGQLVAAGERIWTQRLDA
jgi:hypothetical protein